MSDFSIELQQNNLEDINDEPVGRLINCGIISITWKGNYSDEVTYKFKALVRYDHKLWLHVSKDATTGVKPTLDSTIWVLLTADGTTLNTFQFNFLMNVNEWQYIEEKQLYFIDIKNELISEEDLAFISFIENYDPDGIDAIIQDYCDTYMGYIRLYAKDIPASIIKANAHIVTAERFVLDN